MSLRLYNDIYEFTGNDKIMYNLFWYKFWMILIKFNYLLQKRLYLDE